MAVVSQWALGELFERAPRAVSDPHVNVGPLLGVDHAVRVGLHDVSELLATGETGFDLSIDDTTLTVSREDGGMLATLTVRF